ncbi:cell wall metabolism sensor histidine kinase WalK [Acetobacter sp. DsW_063]|uniref:sensor histidine kinase n=1 Tax=Acetobacter sp. DsW_063 TaxID=1514894 RepID=UPI000A3755B9|nr:ATP-binding protein [Acetobacter sp. DsW_063]
MTPKSFKLPFLPSSLAARTSLLLIVGLAVIEIVGLTIETLDRIAFDERLAEHQAIARTVMVYRTVAEAEPDDRSAIVDRLASDMLQIRLASQPDADMSREITTRESQGVLFMLGEEPLGPRRTPDGRPGDDMARPPPPMEMDPAFHPFHGPDDPNGPFSRNGPPPHMPQVEGSSFGDPGGIRPDIDSSRPAPRRALGIPLRWRPQHIMALGNPSGRARGLAFQLPDDTRWLIARFRIPVATPFSSPLFPLAFGLMTAAGGLLIVWGVRRLIAPVGTLAAAAEALAPDDSGPPLPENGPLEIARAAAAFNAMAARIRRFVSDRTLLLTAIGHDLRTPITRLKLRAEFIDDDEMRQKFLADLNELSAMVEATLAFGRDSSSHEPVSSLNLTALAQTIVDDFTEAHLDISDKIELVGDPPPIIIRARPLSLKRALTNLIGNAIAYGGGARVMLGKKPDGEIVVRIEDDGPGLPECELERMFEPFVRAEESRNRETGGTGLGLSIARTIVRGQGGDIVLRNRSPHGLAAIVTLAA